MKRTLLATAALWLASATFAQQDSTNSMVTDTAIRHQSDTIRVGNFVIVKRNKDGNNNDEKGKSFTIVINSHRHDNDTIKPSKSAFSTNWFIFDLGFANYNDKTNYTEAAGSNYLRVNAGEQPFAKGDLKLLTKSSNVNIWLFMQKLNITKHAINLKYGLGLEMFNFRYDNNISYNKTPAYIFRDSINFSKDKLYTAYATVPFMLNINPWPNEKRLSLSVGASAGYLIGSHTKQKSDERGKDKVRGDFDLNQWRLAYIGELGLGPVRLYGSYSIQPLHDHTLKQYPYTVGVRFSNW